MLLSAIHWDAFEISYSELETTDWICMAWELSSRLLLTPCLDCEKLFEYRLPYSTKAISGLHGRDVQTQKPTFNWTIDNFSEKKLFFNFFSFKIPFEWPCAWFYSKMSSASVTIYCILLGFNRHRFDRSVYNPNYINYILSIRYKTYPLMTFLRNLFFMSTTYIKKLDLQ